MLGQSREDAGPPLNPVYTQAFAAIERDPNQFPAVLEDEGEIVGYLQLTFIPGLSLQGSAVGSDAFFPFNDCVQLAHAAGIEAFIQPGGSVRDKDSIDYCVQNNLAMVITGMRHFRH